MSTEERARDIETNMHRDMHTTMVSKGLSVVTQRDVEILDALVGDGMFQVEKLLAEIEDLNNEVRHLKAVTEQPRGAAPTRKGAWG